MCDGANGNSAAVKGTNEAAGANCANGGKKIETSAGGAITTSYVCSGVDGKSVIMATEAAGAN